ncbi:MAG: carbohydrate kinase family protein [Planctomycetaceae bacterium]|jgi:sugar/nucleoside kinase (ribokinase family)|nr:carbohydrate kinase family protein [Planctomycetaceae bacterium]
MSCLCSGILFADIACYPISHNPQEGELVPTEKIELNLGGCASNAAFALAKLGAPVTLAGCVSDDALSDFVVRAVSVPLINSDFLQRVPGMCPGTAMHINVQNQDRRFITTTGANDKFIFDDTLFDFVKTAAPNPAGRKVLYIGGFFMLRGLENLRSIEFLQAAREHGWTIVLDVVLNGQRDYWHILEPFLPLADFFMPNEHEGEKITGCADPYEQAKVFRNVGAKTVIITQGSVGTLCFSDADNFRSGVYPIEYISGSGSGDAFCAGFIAAQLEGLDLRNAVRWGSAVGASSVRGISTTGTVFNREELLTFLGKHELVFEDI